ncbi:MAG: acyl carrier protein [Planctomycetota bacterium]|jgi:acyl carrier protein|nr:acyl carrier protein [Planctomycetota bacterium]
MTEQEIRRAVLAIIRDVAGLDEEPSLDGEKPLRDQLELDSMDFLDIVMELRKRHRVEVPETDYPQLASLDSTVRYLEPRLASAPGK